MSKAKPSADDLRRFLGYSIITFLSVFLFIPVLWFVNLFTHDPVIFIRWGIYSAFIVLFNILFYYWRYPENWLPNLLALVGINLSILIFEYFWLLESMG